MSRIRLVFVAFIAVAQGEYILIFVGKLHETNHQQNSSSSKRGNNRLFQMCLHQRKQHCL